MLVKWKWTFGEKYSKSIRKNNITYSENKNRENIDLKLADRELTPQRGVNPFLQTDYVNDVAARDMFLKPVNTTFERIKDIS